MLAGLKDLPLDVRVIAASNRDLKTESEAGRFRVDLFYRLSVIQIDIPPLRERGDDVRLLAEHYMSSFRTRLRKNIDEHRSRGARCFSLLRMARQCPRTAQCDRARHDPGRRGNDYDEVSAARFGRRLTCRRRNSNGRIRGSIFTYLLTGCLSIKSRCRWCDRRWSEAAEIKPRLRSCLISPVISCAIA